MPIPESVARPSPGPGRAARAGSRNRLESNRWSSAPESTRASFQTRIRPPSPRLGSLHSNRASNWELLSSGRPSGGQQLPIRRRAARSRPFPAEGRWPRRRGIVSETSGRSISSENPDRRPAEGPDDLIRRFPPRWTGGQVQALPPGRALDPSDTAGRVDGSRILTRRLLRVSVRNVTEILGRFDPRPFGAGGGSMRGTWRTWLRSAARPPAASRSPRTRGSWGS